MLVYLCGPIDQCSDKLEVYNWRDAVKAKLKLYNFNIYDAASAFTISNCRQDFDSLYLINEIALQQSDVIFVNLPKIFTVGTPVELHMAFERRIPIYATIDKELHNSMVLSALLRHGKVFDFINEAMDGLISDFCPEAGRLTNG